MTVSTEFASRVGKTNSFLPQIIVFSMLLIFVSFVFFVVQNFFSLKFLVIIFNKARRGAVVRTPTG